MWSKYYWQLCFLTWCYTIDKVQNVYMFIGKSWMFWYVKEPLNHTKEEKRLIKTSYCVLYPRIIVLCQAKESEIIRECLLSKTSKYSENGETVCDVIGVFNIHLMSLLLIFVGHWMAKIIFVLCYEGNTTWDTVCVKNLETVYWIDFEPSKEYSAICWMLQTSTQSKIFLSIIIVK